MKKKTKEKAKLVVGSGLVVSAFVGMLAGCTYVPPGSQTGGGGTTTNPGPSTSPTGPVDINTNVIYTITFYNNDKTILDTIKAYQGQTISIKGYVPNDVPDGKVFVGWSGYINKDTITVTRDLSLSPQCEAKTLTITFKTLDGNILGSKTVDYGSKITMDMLPSIPPSSDGKTGHWSPNPLDFTSVTSDLIFTAVYDDSNVVTVTFMINGVATYVTVPMGTYLSPSDIPALPVEEGSVYSWDVKDIESIQINAPMTITAIKENVVHKVSFALASAPNDILVTYNATHGSSITSLVDIDKFIPEGQEFVRLVGGSLNNIISDQTILIETRVKTVNITIIDENHPTTTNRSITASYGDDITSVLGNPTPVDGFDVKWQVETRDQVTVDLTHINTTVDFTIRAVSTRKVYTVTYYDKDNGYINSMSVTHGSQCNIPTTAVPNVAGKQFTGWEIFDNSDSSLNGTLLSGRLITGDLKVRAVYTDLTYTVIFVGQTGEQEKVTRDYGSKFTEEEIKSYLSNNTMVQVGYQYTSYTVTGAGSGDPLVGITNNMVIQGIYTETQVSVTYYDTVYDASGNIDTVNSPVITTITKKLSDINSYNPPVTPERTFKYWMTEDKTQITSTNDFIGQTSIKVYANFEPVICTVMFTGNNKNITINIPYGAVLSSATYSHLIPSASQMGIDEAQFGGWDRDLSTPITSNNTVFTARVITSVSTHTVIFHISFIDTEDNETAYDTTIVRNSVPDGGMAQYPTESELANATQDSSFLVGKYLADVNGVVTNVTADGHVTLTYRLNSYTINYMNANDTVFISNTVHYSSTDKLPSGAIDPISKEVVTPSFEGYIFNGWDYDSAGLDLTSPSNNNGMSFNVKPIFVKDTYKIKIHDIEGNLVTFDKEGSLVDELSIKYGESTLQSIIDTIKVASGSTHLLGTQAILADNPGYNFIGLSLNMGSSELVSLDSVFSPVGFDDGDEIHLYPYTTTNRVTITFFNETGNVLEFDSVIKGKVNLLSPDYAVTGRDLIGWANGLDSTASDYKVYNIDSNKKINITSVLDNLSLYPVFKAQSYDVKFVDLNGDELTDGSDPYVIKAEYGENIEDKVLALAGFKDAVLTASGISLAEASHYELSFDKPLTSIANDLTIVVTAKKVIYSVSFTNSNGDSFGVQKLEYQQSPVVISSEPTADPTRSGYEFAGWQLVGDTSNKIYYFGTTAPTKELPTGYTYEAMTSYKASGDADFVAYFVAQKYEVIFQVQDETGATVNFAKVIVTHGQNALTSGSYYEWDSVAGDWKSTLTTGNVPEPTLTGKYFTGWNRLVTFVTSSSVVQAMYNSETLTITFRNDEDGDKLLKETTVPYNTASGDLVGPTISKPGYDFKGWVDASDSSKTYADDAALQAALFTKNTVLNPVFTPKNYSVSVNYMNNSGVSQTVNAASQVAFDSLINTDAQLGMITESSYQGYTGYHIAKWVDDDGNEYDKDLSKIKLSYVPTNGTGVVLTAVYEENSHTITYVDRFGNVLRIDEVKFDDVINGSSMLQVPSVAGKKPGVWSDGINKYDPNESTTSLTVGDADIVLTAEYTDLEVKVTIYDWNITADDYAATSTVITLTYGEVLDFVQLPTPTEREGKYFNNTWAIFDVAGGTVTDTIFTPNGTPVITDIAICPLYDNSTYTVTFAKEEGSVIKISQVVSKDAGGFNFILDSSAVGSGQITAPDASVVDKAGYTLAGWVNRDDSSEKYELNKTHRLTHDVTLIPYYTQDVYKLNVLDANGNALTTTPIDIHYNDSLDEVMSANSVVVPTIAGKTFASFVADASSTSTVIVDGVFKVNDHDSTVTHVIKATYVDNKYTVTFIDANGVTLVTADDYLYNSSITVVDSMIGNTAGKKFIGYTLSGDTSGNYFKYNSVTNSFEYVDSTGSSVTYAGSIDATSGLPKVISDLVFNALYDTTTYSTTLKFNVGEDEYSLKVEDIEYNTSIGAHVSGSITVTGTGSVTFTSLSDLEDYLKANSPAGKYFAGWSISLDTGVTSELPSEVSAVYARNNYVFEFYVDPSKDPIVTSTVTDGNYLEVFAYNPQGSKFNGWFYSSDGTSIDTTLNLNIESGIVSKVLGTGVQLTNGGVYKFIADLDDVETTINFYQANGNMISGVSVTGDYSAVNVETLVPDASLVTTNKGTYLYAWATAPSSSDLNYVEYVITLNASDKAVINLPYNKEEIRLYPVFRNLDYRFNFYSYKDTGAVSPLTPSGSAAAYELNTTYGENIANNSVISDVSTRITAIFNADPSYSAEAYYGKMDYYELQFAIRNDAGEFVPVDLKNLPVLERGSIKLFIMPVAKTFKVTLLDIDGTVKGTYEAAYGSDLSTLGISADMFNYNPLNASEEFAGKFTYDMNDISTGANANGNIALDQLDTLAITGDLTLTAQYTVRKSTVTLMVPTYDNSGKVTGYENYVQVSDVSFGSGAFDSSNTFKIWDKGSGAFINGAYVDPTIDGHKFNGWDVNLSTVTGDLIARAVFTTNTYRFEIEREDGSRVNLTSLSYYDSLNKLFSMTSSSIFEKTGYTLLGFTYNDGTSDKVITTTDWDAKKVNTLTGLDQSIIEFRPVYEAKTFTGGIKIVSSLDGVEITLAEFTLSNNFDYGADLTTWIEAYLSDSNLVTNITPLGHTLESLIIEGSDHDLLLDSSLIASTDDLTAQIVIKATWVSNVHTISYYDSTNTLIKTETVKYGSAFVSDTAGVNQYSALAVPAVVGRENGKWSLVFGDYSSAITIGTSLDTTTSYTMPDNDLKLYAVYEVKSSTIKFLDVDGNEISAKEVSVEYGDIISKAKEPTLSEIGTKAGYTWNNTWVDTATGKLVDLDTTLITTDMVLEPVLMRDAYTITYRDEGDKFIMNQTVEYVSGGEKNFFITAPSSSLDYRYQVLNHPTGLDKDYFNFVGWYDSENPSVQYLFNDTTGEFAITQNTILKPLYVAKEYKLSLYDSEGNVLASDLVVHYGETLDSIISDNGVILPEIAGREFSGFALKDDATNAVLSSFIPSNESENSLTEMKAVYDATVYGVTFTDWNNVVLNFKNYGYGSVLDYSSDFPTVARGGFEFVGWGLVTESDPNGYEKIYSFDEDSSAWNVYSYDAATKEYNLTGETVAAADMKVNGSLSYRAMYRSAVYSGKLTVMNKTGDKFDITITQLHYQDKISQGEFNYPDNFLDGFGLTALPTSINELRQVLRENAPYGNEFAGFSTSLDTYVNGEVGDISATYTGRTYNVNYHIDSAADSDIHSSTTIKNGEYLSLINIAKEGYSFLGWSLLPDQDELTATNAFKSQIISMTELNANDLGFKTGTFELYPIFTQTTYDLTFLNFDGVTLHTVTGAKYGDKIKYEGVGEEKEGATAGETYVIPVRVGYVFLGWNGLTPDGDGYFTVTDNAVIRATYQAIKVKYNIYADEDTYASGATPLATGSVNYGTSIKNVTDSVITVPKGYTLKNFNVDVASLTQDGNVTYNVTDGEYYFDQVVNVYPRFDFIDYTINYYTIEGSGEKKLSTQTYHIGEMFTTYHVTLSDRVLLDWTFGEATDVNKFNLNSGTLYEFDESTIDKLEALGNTSKLGEYSYKAYANWQNVTFTTTFLGLNGEGLGSMANLSGKFDPSISGYQAIVNRAKASMATASEEEYLYWLGSDGKQYKLDSTSTTAGLLDISTVMIKANMTFTLRSSQMKQIQVVFEYYNTSSTATMKSEAVYVTYGGSAVAPVDVYTGILDNNQRFVKWDTSFDVITSAITVRAIYSSATISVEVYKDTTTTGTSAIIDTLDLALGRVLTVADLSYLVSRTQPNAGLTFDHWSISFDNGLNYQTIAGSVTLSQPSVGNRIIIRPVFEQIKYKITFKSSIVNDGGLSYEVNVNDNASVRQVYLAHKSEIDSWLAAAIATYNADSSHSIVKMNVDNFWYFEGSIGMSEKIDASTSTGAFASDITSDLVVCPLLEAEKVNIKVFYTSSSGDVNTATTLSSVVDKKLSFETSFLTGLGTNFFSNLVNTNGKATDYHADVYSIGGFVAANDDGSFAFSGSDILANLIKVEDFQELTAIRSASYRAYYVPVTLNSHFVFDANKYKAIDDTTIYTTKSIDYGATYNEVGFKPLNDNSKNIEEYANEYDEQIYGYSIIGYKRLNSTSTGDLTSDTHYYYSDVEMLARLRASKGDEVADNAIDLTTLSIDSVANGFNFEAVFVQDKVDVTYISSVDAFYNASGNAQGLTYSTKTYNLAYGDKISKITDVLSNQVNAYNKISKFEIFNRDPQTDSTATAVVTVASEDLLKNTAILFNLYGLQSNSNGKPTNLYIRPVYESKSKTVSLIFDDSKASKISDSTLRSYISSKVEGSGYSLSRIGSTSYYRITIDAKYGASMSTMLLTLNDSLITDFNDDCNGYNIDQIMTATITTEGETTEVSEGSKVTNFSSTIVNDSISSAFVIKYAYQEYELSLNYFEGTFVDSSKADDEVIDAFGADMSSIEGRTSMSATKLKFTADETFQDFYDRYINVYLCRLGNTAIEGFTYKIGSSGEETVLFKDFAKTYIRGAYNIKPIYKVCRTKKVLIISEDAYKTVSSKSGSDQQLDALKSENLLMTFGPSTAELNTAGFTAPTPYTVNGTGSYGVATATYKQMYDYQISSSILDKLNTSSTIDPYNIIKDNYYQNEIHNHRFTNVEIGGKYGQYQLAGWNKLIVGDYVVLSPIWQVFGGLSAMSAQEALNCGITYTISGGKVTITNVSTEAIGSTAHLAWQHFNLTAAGTDTTANGAFTVGFTEKYDTVSLPSFIDGYPVTAIAENALDPLGASDAIVQTPDISRGRIAGSFAKYIIIPENVTEIKDYTFGRIYNTASVTIPRSVIDNNGINHKAFRNGETGRYILMQDDQVNSSGTSLDSNARLFYYGHHAQKGVLEYILTPYNFDYEKSKKAATAAGKVTPTAGAYNSKLNVANEYAEKESGYRRLQALLSVGFLQSDITPVNNATRYSYQSRVDIKKFDISDYVVPDKIMATEVDFSMRFSSSLFYERELPQISDATTTNYQGPESLYGNEFSRSRWFATNGYSGIGLWAYRGDPFWDTPKWNHEANTAYTGTKTMNVPSDWWINLGDSGTSIPAANIYTTQYNYDHYLHERAGMTYYSPGYENWTYNFDTGDSLSSVSVTTSNYRARSAQGIYKSGYRTTADRREKLKQIFANSATRSNSIARNALVIPTYVVMYDNEGDNWTKNYDGTEHKVEIRSVPGLPSDSNMYIHNSSTAVNSTGYRLPGSGLPFQSDYTRVGKDNVMLYLNGQYNNSWASSDGKLGLYMVDPSYNSGGKNTAKFSNTVTGYGTSSNYGATLTDAIRTQYTFKSLSAETTSPTLTDHPYEGSAPSGVTTGLKKPSALSLNAQSIPSYGDINIRVANTGMGFMGLSPWNDSRFTYTLSMINLGNNSNSKLEVVTLLNILNQAYEFIYYSQNLVYYKYNPKVYFGTLSSLAAAWNYNLENGRETYSFWPESYQQSTQLTTPNASAKYGTEQFYESSSNPGYRVRKSMSTNMVTYYDTATSSWQFLIDNLYEYDYNI